MKDKYLIIEVEPYYVTGLKSIGIYENKGDI
jgi:hypothetical protein